jgi:RimJ/RimL family protein N-acetyltransferase
MRPDKFAAVTAAQNTNSDAPRRTDGWRNSPYASGQVDVWWLRNGTRILQRPVLPQDAVLLGELVARQSARTRRNRFHAAVNQLSTACLDQMSRVDHDRHVALVMTIIVAGREQIIADARYVVDDSGDGAEFAVLIDDSWQGFGLGQRAMDALMQVAKLAGLRRLHGEVLARNAPMLALMRRCNFCCTPVQNDDSMVHAETVLSHAGRCQQARLLDHLRGWLTSHWGQRPLGAAMQAGGFYE